MDEVLENAKLAEQVERYEDMAKFMKEFVENTDSPLNSTNRNLLSVAYKNVVGSKRSSWRILSGLESKTTKEEELTLIKSYRKDIEAELKKVIEEVLDLLNRKLIKSIDDKTSDEEKVAYVFCTKMKGDYYRYLCEVEEAGSDSQKTSRENSQKAYEASNEAAVVNLPPTHPIRLGLMLNFSVFYYEICNEPGKACDLAKKAFDEAIAELDQLKEDSYKDSTLIMQLLRDNLTLWTSDRGEEDEVEQ